MQPRDAQANTNCSLPVKKLVYKIKFQIIVIVLLFILNA